MRVGAGGIWIPRCMVLLVNPHAQCGSALYALRTGTSRLGAGASLPPLDGADRCQTVMTSTGP
jgi:hypothetical protein